MMRGCQVPGEWAGECRTVRWPEPHPDDARMPGFPASRPGDAATCAARAPAGSTDREPSHTASHFRAVSVSRETVAQTVRRFEVPDPAATAEAVGLLLVALVAEEDPPT